VQHHYNGYLAEYRSSQSFTDGMEWIVNHPDKVTLREQARQTVMDKFSEQVIAQKHLKIYEQIINS